MLRGLLITLTLVVWSANGWAKEFNYQAHLDMRLDSLDIEAPGSLEGNLLKPVLMGRQQVMKVRFRPPNTESIHLQLYLQ